MSFPLEMTIVFFIICAITTVLSAVQNETIVFSSSQEVFVGEDALLVWTIKEDLLINIADIKFGVVTRPATHGERLDAIVVKTFRPYGKIVWNTRAPHVASFVNRTTVLENRTAGFRISKVHLNDSSEFYCTVKQIGSTQTMITDYVQIKVIDVQILNETSSQDVVSWRGHKIRLHCNARVVPNTHTSFVWRNKAKGGTIVDPSKQRDHVTSSLLRIVTYTDDEFGPYECVAMTTATNYTHEIRIKRLYEPSAPNNFSHDRSLTATLNCSVVAKLAWMSPLEDGGALVTSYMVEYKPFGQEWSKAVHRRVVTNYIEICRPPRDQGGDGLRVRVSAKNKVGVGKPSPATIVTFWDEPTAPQNLRTQLVRNLGDPFIQLTWGYPRDDGGVSVSAYQIEYKPVGSPWSNAAKLVTEEQQSTLWKTSKDINIYEVRIQAINGVGVSEASNILIAAFAVVVVVVVVVVV
ncbi:hypothetical protein QZH41_018851 [Actinostola sp. cb2023]|nr:hypothetical protein QZH41_018851 [Actinostola sp. cb2023]